MQEIADEQQHWIIEIDVLRWPRFEVVRVNAVRDDAQRQAWIKYT